MENRNQSRDSPYNKSNRCHDDSYDKKESDRDTYRDSSEREQQNNSLFKRDSGYQYQGFSQSLIIESKDQLVRIEKNFYKENENVRRRSYEDVKAFRESANIIVKSDNAPNPVSKFDESSFPNYILDVIRTKGFNKPTPVQAQGWPIVLKGHDLIAIAQTGSGKTLGFLLPAIVHIRAQEPLRRGDGPIGLVLAPTRELAMQIYDEFKPFGSVSKLRGTCIYGGAERYPQKKDLRDGCELVIATPGRLIDFLESGDTNLKRVSYLVIDEADRMLDMGFIPQIEKIVGYIRKDRQTLMWSATWPHEVRKLAEDLCKEKPMHIVVGEDELTVNKAISQSIKVVSSRDKFDTLLRLIRGIYDGSKILIFCQTKKNSDWLSRTLQNEGFRSIAIHGDKSQKDRDNIMNLFKDQKVPILVATNLAARGLDVKDIKYVINYDFPNQIEEYVHRVGRTGRAGALGTSFTLFTEEDSRLAKPLVKILSDNQQVVPEGLLSLVSDRKFKEKFTRYDRRSINQDTKDFSDHEKASDTSKWTNQKNSNSSKNENDSNDTRHSDTSSANLFNSSFLLNPSSNMIHPSTNLSSFYPVENLSQQQFNPQQYNPQQYNMMLAQLQIMHMTQQQQQYVPMAQQQNEKSCSDRLPSIQSSIFETSSKQINSIDSNSSKKHLDEIRLESGKYNNTDYGQFECSGKQNNFDPMKESSYNQNLGNSYYRDTFDSHGNSSYNQRATSPRSTISSKKRSRFSFIHPQSSNIEGSNQNSSEMETRFEQN